MIASIEQAIKQRLSDGLGRMVTGVFTYGGEFDSDGLAQVVNQFPAVWVMFAGIKHSKKHDTRGTRYKVTGEFTVLVGDRASGSEADSRFGGMHSNDVGTYRLLQACRHLLTNQSLGLSMSPIQPGAVKSLFSRTLEHEAISVFALAFEAEWFEDALLNGGWPRPTIRDDVPSEVHDDVQAYGGRTDPEYPDLEAVTVELRQPPKTKDQPADMAGIVKTEVKHE